ncbi:hypothetical protein CRUP_027614 [Coryphaenoides rupestris]|nr:hypothetical protein CRUP_027614 [Coryphaenoides rupestris]
MAVELVRTQSLSRLQLWQEGGGGGGGGERKRRRREEDEGGGVGRRLCADGGSAQDNSSLKRVAVVEDFFDIIYAMHVEMGADPGRAPKHAGQKKTYKAVRRRDEGGGGGGGGERRRRRVGAGEGVEEEVKEEKEIAETYAFLPREAVTRFLMSCGECQKRMHINPSTAEFKENDRPTSLVPDLIDYNMPLTATYLKQMKLQCMTTNERTNPIFLLLLSSSSSSSSSSPAPEDDSSESGSANGLPAPGSPEAPPSAGTPPDGGAPYAEVTENGVSAPLDFSTTSSSSSSEEQQPVNLSERSPPTHYPAELNRKYPVKAEYNNNNNNKRMVACNETSLG